MERPSGLPGLSVTVRRRRLRRALLTRRRPVAAVAAAVAVVVGLQAASPPPAPTRTVVTATRDLPGGKVLGPGDLTTTSYPTDTVPAGAAGATSALLGRTTTGPVRAGEPVTDVRVVGTSLLEGYPGLVAAPVRVGDPASVSLLHVGERVDVIAADPQGHREASVVAEDAPVVALPPSSDTALTSGGLVVLAVSDETARVLAAAAVSAYLSVVLTR